MSGELRREFYARLERDYKSEGERSFLYRYFMQNPPKRRGGERQRDIRRDIQTFLYDARRKADRSLSMFGEYCEHMGIAPFLAGTEMPEPKAVDAVYQTLRGGENDGVLVPVYIDPASGAGLYIIGTGLLGELAAGVKGVCCYGILAPYALELVDDQDGDYTWLLWQGDRQRAEERLGYPTAAEGLRWLRETVAVETLDRFATENGPCPENCPDALRRYFSPAEPPDWRAVAAYGRQRFEEEKELS